MKFLIVEIEKGEIAFLGVEEPAMENTMISLNQFPHESLFPLHQLP